MEKNSFLEYLNLTIKNKIQRDIYYIKKKNRGYKKVINKIYKKYPDITSNLIENKQIGGADAPLNIITSIKDFLERYKKNTQVLDSVKNESETVKRTITEIVNMINTLPKTVDDNLYNIKEQDYINVFEAVKKVLTKNNEIYELNKLRGTINFEVFGDYEHNKEEYIKIKNELIEFNNKIKRIPNDIDNQADTYKQNIENLNSVFNEEYNKLKTHVDAVVKGYNRLTESYNLGGKKLFPALNLNKDMFCIIDTNNDTNKEYDGEITIKVNNNLFLDQNAKSIVTNIDSVFKNVENIPETEFVTLNIGSNNILSTVYNPQFLTMDTKSLSGGGIEDILIKNTGELLFNIDKAREQYITALNEYNLRYQRYLFHTAFLMLIATSQVVDTSSYIAYRYLSEGIAVFYLDILKNMKHDMDTRNSAVATYLKKYHYNTIVYLMKFLEEVEKLGLCTDRIIFIEKSDDIVKYCVHLFNHFKRTMDNYKKLNMNAITIYARINDFGKEPELPSNTDNRFFQSDFYKHKIDCNDPNATNSNDHKDISHQRLTVNYKKCNLINEEKVKSYMFTQTFDSIKYNSAETISAYMGMSTDLANRKGIAIMTYGYSGTGKTYTIFGKERTGDSGATVRGLLQSTLKNIKELNNVSIRLFELYGRGVPFKNYWNSTKITNLNEKNSVEYIDTRTNSKFRCPKVNPEDDNVYKEIRYYNFSFEGSEPSVQDYTTVSKENIPKYTNEADNYNNTYTKINDFRSKIDNFPLLVEKIDEKRKKSGTIRETPNNPESSRSVMIYDFKLFMEGDPDNPVPFIIIDLPGREEIIESFADTFLSKPLTKLLLQEADYEDIIESIKYNLNFFLNKSNGILANINNVYKQQISEIIENTNNLKGEYNELNRIEIINTIKKQCSGLINIINNISCETDENICEDIKNETILMIKEVLYYLDSIDEAYKNIYPDISDYKRLISIKEKIKFKYSSKDIKMIKLAIKSMSINPYLLPIIHLDKLTEYNEKGQLVINNITGEDNMHNIDLTYTGIDQIYNTILKIFRDFHFDEKSTLIKNILNHKIGEINIKDVLLKEYFNSSFTKDTYENIIFNKEGYPMFNNQQMSRGNYSYDFQYFSVLCIEIMAELIETQKYDVIDKMMKQCADVVINEDIKQIINVLDDNDINFLNGKYFIGEKLNGITKEKLIEKAQYDYISTPSEGIFINENISGLIDYLSKKLTKSSDLQNKVEIMDIQRSEQIKAIRELATLTGFEKKKNHNFGQKNKTIYEKIRGLYSYEDVSGTSSASSHDNKKPIKEPEQEQKPEPEQEQKPEQISVADRLRKFREREQKINEENEQNKTRPKALKKSSGEGGTTGDIIYNRPPSINEGKLYNILDKTNSNKEDKDKQQLYFYNSNGLFNSHNPIIENILCPYLKKIEDYKVFYLFSNFKQQFKCKHQNKLLENTEKFISTIVPDLSKKD